MMRCGSPQGRNATGRIALTLSTGTRGTQGLLDPTKCLDWTKASLSFLLMCRLHAPDEVACILAFRFCVLGCWLLSVSHRTIPWAPSLIMLTKNFGFCAPVLLLLLLPTKKILKRVLKKRAQMRTQKKKEMLKWYLKAYF